MMYDAEYFSDRIISLRAYGWNLFILPFSSYLIVSYSKSLNLKFVVYIGDISLMLPILTYKLLTMYMRIKCYVRRYETKAGIFIFQDYYKLKNCDIEECDLLAWGNIPVCILPIWQRELRTTPAPYFPNQSKDKHFSALNSCNCLGNRDSSFEKFNS